MPLRLRSKLLISIGLFAMIVVATLAIMAEHASKHARDWLEESLEREFKCDVDLTSFEISIFPEIKAHGEGLVFHFHEQQEMPPMIAVKSFTMHVTLAQL